MNKIINLLQYRTVEVLNIPDIKFRKAIIEGIGGKILSRTEDPIESGQLQLTNGQRPYEKYNLYTSDLPNLEYVTSLSDMGTLLNPNAYYDFTGIHYFKNLREFTYTGNGNIEPILTHPNFSKFTCLSITLCNTFKETNLDLSTSRDLNVLCLNHCGLHSLNLSNINNLKFLAINNNHFKTLDIPLQSEQLLYVSIGNQTSVASIYHRENEYILDMKKIVGAKNTKKILKVAHAYMYEPITGFAYFETLPSETTYRYDIGTHIFEKFSDDEPPRKINFMDVHLKLILS